MANPFHPAPGALPARLIGRETELAAIREAVRRAGIREAPSPAVFLGQRGMGKTVLLRSLRDAGGAAALSLQIETLPNRDLASRVLEKIDELLASVEPLPARAGSILKRVLDVVPKLSYELPNDAGTIAVSGPSEKPPKYFDDQRSLIAMLVALRDAARAAGRYLLITLDEVQDADLASLETLATFVHESAQGETPVLLAIAGLNETRDLLDKLRTYVQRWNAFELRFLTFDETVEALREPITGRGVTIEEDALYLLATESAGYPYFIQAYGAAAWDARRNETIAVSDVNAIVPDVRRRNEMAFYVRPLSKLTDREMLFALALARLGAGSHGVGAVAHALGVKAPDVSSTRTSLVRKHVISSPVPGKVEFHLPFTERFLRQHEAEYDTAGVRRAGEDLARRRSDDERPS